MARLGKYELIRRLARRGITERYLARIGGEPLIVYRLLPELCAEIEIVRAFVSEARAATGLEHPNLVTVREVGKSADGYFFVGDHVPGLTLAKVLRRAHDMDNPQPAPHAVALMIASRICAALHEVHMLSNEEGVPLGQIHGGVQPHNLLLTGRGQALLRGLGVGRATALAAREHADLAYDIDAAAFLCPEQVAGDNLDPRSDIFSTGALLFELLAGRRVFMRESVDVTLKAISVAAIPALPNVDDELFNIVTRALARDRRERYVTAADMQVAIDAVIRRGEPAGPEQLAAYLRRLFGDELAKLEEASVMVPLPPPPVPPTSADAAPPTAPPAPTTTPTAPAPGAPAPAAPAGPAGAPVVPPLADRPSRRTLIMVTAAGGLLLLALLIVALLASGDPDADRPTLQLESEPAGATVYVDGSKRHGRTPLVLSDLTAGNKHHLVLMLDDHETWKGYLTLEPAERHKLVATLKPKVTAGAAKLVVVAPEEARVYLDSEIRGRGPLQIEVQPGVRHALTVTQEGFHDRTLPISPLKPNETRRLTVELEPAPVDKRPRPRPRKPTGITIPRAKGGSIGGRQGERLPPARPGR